MNNINEDDLCRLESMLDGELSASETQHLQQRLLDEPGLRGALEQLQHQRELRRQVFAQNEPDIAASRSLAAQWVRSSSRRAVWRHVGQYVKVAVAAAACFVAGWVGKGIFMPEGRPHFGGDTVIATPDAPQGPFQVVLADETGRVLAVQRFHTADEAMRFAADLSSLQSHRQTNAEPVLISDQF